MPSFIKHRELPDANSAPSEIIQCCHTAPTCAADLHPVRLMATTTFGPSYLACSSLGVNADADGPRHGVQKALDKYFCVVFEVQAVLVRGTERTFPQDRDHFFLLRRVRSLIAGSCCGTGTELQSDAQKNAVESITRYFGPWRSCTHARVGLRIMAREISIPDEAHFFVLRVRRTRRRMGT